MVKGLQPIAQHVAKIINSYDPHRIFVAFSGGRDSLALLQIVQDLAKHKISIKPHVIHINHQLQDCADDMANWCQNYCDVHALDCTVIKVAVDTNLGGVEAGARHARYQAFAKLLTNKHDIILTGHHADDQIETFFLQLLRSSRPQATAASSESRAIGSGLLVRPVLEWGAVDLHAVLPQGIAIFKDPSNKDRRFMRNYLRLDVLPLLAKRFDLGGVVRRRIAADRMLKDACAAWISEARNSLYCAHSLSYDLTLLFNYTAEQQYLIMADILQDGVGGVPPASQQQEFMRQLLTSALDSQPSLTWQGRTWYRYQQRLFYYTPGMLALDKELWWFDIASNPTITLPGRYQLTCCDPDFYPEDKYKIIPAHMLAGFSLPRRKYKDTTAWLAEFKIPPWLRYSWPLITDVNNKVVTVPCMSFNVTHNSKVMVCG